MMLAAAIQTLARRRGRCLLLAAVTTSALGLCAGSAAAAGPPVLHVELSHVNAYGAQRGSCPTKKAEPTATEPCGVDPFTEKEAGNEGETFARESGGNTYAVTVKNDGEEETKGTVTVIDELPKGILLGGSEPKNEFSAPGWSCTLPPSGARIECSTKEKRAATASFNPIKLYVAVSPAATNPSKNKAMVSGGGASPQEAEDSTTITPAVPFGVSSFAVSMVDQLKNPFSQAGGHPFEVTTEVLLNYNTTNPSTSNGPGSVAVAGNGAKEIQVELPPGFTGNPQNTPRCPLAVFKAEGVSCPAKTAVGFTNTVLFTGLIKNGKVTPPEVFASSTSASVNVLVYNLEPTPGRPAELGFKLAGALPFALEAKVRSDGDYGVTVGDSAVGEKPIATKVTLCENGAMETGSAKFKCKEAPPSSKPFVSNPTQCAPSASSWTLLTNPWDEPTNYVSKTVSANPNPLEGCEKLQFNPELEFKPSPPAEGGTTQADEPTGMTLNLRVPQPNEAAVNATPALKNVKMTLPAGMTVSPSAADGLQACTNAQFGLGTEFGPGSQHTEPAKPAACPLASQLGTVEVFTPLLSGAPTIMGFGSKNGVLTCSNGSWSGSPTLSYRWLLNGEPIKGATAPEYTLTEEQFALDNGKPVQCEVTATNAGGQSIAVSKVSVVGTEPATAPPELPASLPAPSGTASVGSVLTCQSGAWNGSPTSFAYQFLRNSEPIAGASSPPSSSTSFGYTLVPEDLGKVIQCRVIAKNVSGETIADSAAVVASPVPSPPPPLPGAPLQGQVFQAEPECSLCTNEDAQDGKMVRLFIQVLDPRDGLVLKLHGVTRLNTVTGQLTTEFTEQPQQPFELLQLKLKGGPRAPLANSQTCGPAVTSADLTPWSSPFTPDATPSSEFAVDWNGAGGACPATLPFGPSFEAGTEGPNATTAGASPSFSLKITRRDREQFLSGVQVHMPLGLVGKIVAVKQCGEAEVHAAESNTGECPAESQLGIATAGAGPGPHPFFTTGKVYLTGPYKGAPFGLAIVTLAKAGPFNLGNIVVRSAISIDPNTAAVTVTSDPLPQIKDGVPLRLREVHVEVEKQGFMINPTNCSAQKISATLTGLQGASAQVSSPFGVGSCDKLPFSPQLTAEAGGQGSKANGTSFVVRVKAAPGQANIAKTFLQLPVALPSRLTTIQKACVAAVFEANPAGCPEGSNVGMAVAHSPLLKNPLVGPAYLVSHGSAAFPDVEFVLQGEGITLVLDGKTDIKKGITYSHFETVPDAPVTTFETVLPAGPHSALSAVLPDGTFNVCNTPLIMPTEITGQNGAVIKQNTRVATTGCPKLAKPTVKITKVTLKGNVLLVTVKTGTTGIVRASGFGLTTTRKQLSAGTHEIRVPLTKTGRSMGRRHKKTAVRVSLTVGKQAVANTTRVRL